MATLNVEEQYEYLRKCAAGTNFVVNRKKSPKAEFHRLALRHLGWAPASSEWCKHWKACFCSMYIWRSRAEGTDNTRTNGQRSASPSTSSAGSASTSSTFSSTESDGIVSSGRDSPVPPVPPCGRRRRRRNSKDLERMEQHFDREYGKNYKDLPAWQKLCADVRIAPVPASITQCKKALKKVYINIFDFEAGHPHDFGTLSALKSYSFRTNKVYPLSRAKKDTFLRALLHVFFFEKYNR